MTQKQEETLQLMDDYINDGGDIIIIKEFFEEYKINIYDPFVGYDYESNIRFLKDEACDEFKTYMELFE